MHKKTLPLALHLRTRGNVVYAYPLCVIMSSTISSVLFIASAPMLVRFFIDLSTSSSMMPSTELTHLPSMESNAESRAVDTPDDIFRAHEGLAPSHIMPVILAIMFLTELQMRQ